MCDVNGHAFDTVAPWQRAGGMNWRDRGQMVLDPLGYNVRTYYNNRGGGGRDSTSASQLRAQIAREQWNDYKTRFQPLENILLGYANNKDQFVQNARTQAVGQVDKAYGLAQPQIERRAVSYGLDVTPEMQGKIAQRLGYDKSLAEVQAANQGQRLAQDQVQGIISGGLLTNSRQAIPGQPKQVGG